MTDYNELISALRDADQVKWKRLSLDAAEAIEELQAEVDEAKQHNTGLLNMNELTRFPSWEGSKTITLPKMEVQHE